MENFLENVKKVLADFFVNKSLDVFCALAILATGFLLARWIGNVITRALEKKDMEPPVRLLIVRVVRLLVFAMVLVIALDKLGVPITPLLAGASVAGVGVGLAMQGVLGNLVAGLVIIMTKPFRVGEYVEIVGVSGGVLSIDLLATTLQHGDLSRVKIPNRKIIGEILHNYGKIRQLDLSVGVSYSCKPGEALAVVKEILAQNPRVLKDPAPAVGISSLGDFAVNISVKPWVAAPDYGLAGGEINQAILETFRARQIEIPFPQREIRILGGGSAGHQS